VVCLPLLCQRSDMAVGTSFASVRPLCVLYCECSFGKEIHKQLGKKCD